MLEGHCHCHALRWKYDGTLDSATACSCTICRRYGALWGYGWEEENITTIGPSTVYTRGALIGFHFCPTCGCLAYYRALKPVDDGRRKLAVNLRMVSDFASIADLPIRHFDGLDLFDELPRDHRHVVDMWF